MLQALAISNKIEPISGGPVQLIVMLGLLSRMRVCMEEAGFNQNIGEAKLVSYEAHLTVEERLQHNTCTHMHEMTYMFIIQEFNMEHTRY